MKFQIGDLAAINNYSEIGIPPHIGKLCKIIDNNRTALYHYRVRLMDTNQVFPVYEKELTRIYNDDPILSYNVGDIVDDHLSHQKGSVTQIDYFYRQIEVRLQDGTHGVFDVDYINTIGIQRPLKIGLIGKMRSGKDTIAEYAVDKYHMTQFAFGNELKRYYHELFGTTEKKPREGYQWLGQTLRQRDENIWVRKCFEAINKSSLKHVIISDVRQPNEFVKCKQEGYVMIKVDCDDTTRLQRIIEKNDQFRHEDLQHETELHIDEFKYDYVINNDGTLDNLYKQFDEIVTEMRGYK